MTLASGAAADRRSCGGNPGRDVVSGPFPGSLAVRCGTGCPVDRPFVAGPGLDGQDCLRCVGLPLVIGPPTPPRLRSRTVQLSDLPDLSTLLDSPSDEGRCVWIRQHQGLIGWGCAARIETAGPARFADADTWWLDASRDAQVDDPLRLPGTGPVAFGSFAFASGSASGASLIVPSITVGRRGDIAWMTRLVDTNRVSDAAAEAFLADTSLPSAAAGGPSDVPDGGAGHELQPRAETPHARREPGETTFADGARSGPRWAEAVAQAVTRIGAGALDKVVLARDLYAQADTPIDLGLVLRRLADQYDRTWVFEVDGLVGATPEMLVRLERGLVTSRVLAGTIRRTGDDQRDLALAASLARSSKDLEEHEYAVRSVAQALAPHCTSMAVPESPFVIHLPNVMHLASDMAGRLRNGVTALGLVSALHPSAAVCGTPREVAQAVIAELEGMDRCRYAGPVGWTDATGDGEWGIALRCGAVDPADPRRMRLFAGCGIVAGSDPEAELAESDAKLIPMRTVLQG